MGFRVSPMRDFPFPPHGPVHPRFRNSPALVQSHRLSPGPPNWHITMSQAASAAAALVASSLCGVGSAFRAATSAHLSLRRIARCPRPLRPPVELRCTNGPTAPEHRSPAGPAPVEREPSSRPVMRFCVSTPTLRTPMPQHLHSRIHWPPSAGPLPVGASAQLSWCALASS